MNYTFILGNFVSNSLIFYTLILISFLLFIYRLFLHFEKSGFSKEKSLDTILMSVIFLTISSVFFLNNINVEYFLAYFTQLYFFIPLYGLFMFLYIVSRINSWSFYKVLDFYSIELSILYSIYTFALSIYYFNYEYLIASLLFITLFFILVRINKSKFSRLFFLEIAKKDEITFIGGISLIFLIYVNMLATLYIVFVMEFNPYKNYYLLTNILAFLIFTIIFVKRSKKFKLKWNLPKNLLRNKDRSYSKSKNTLEHRLID